jgi:hypothetical protein
VGYPFFRDMMNVEIELFIWIIGNIKRILDEMAKANVYSISLGVQ